MLSISIFSSAVKSDETVKVLKQKKLQLGFQYIQLSACEMNKLEYVPKDVECVHVSSRCSDQYALGAVRSEVRELPALSLYVPC